MILESRSLRLAALSLASVLLAAGCAPVGERYRLLPPPARLTEPPPLSVQRLVFADRIVSPGDSRWSEFVFAASPIDGLIYGAWNSCAAERDQMFYAGYLDGGALELQTLGVYPEVRPYCGFSLASDGDTILVFGGRTRPASGWLQPRLHSQVLLLDPERGTALRLSAPRWFTGRLARVFFDAQAGSYILTDHRGAHYRLRLP